MSACMCLLGLPNRSAIEHTLWHLVACLPLRRRRPLPSMPGEVQRLVKSSGLLPVTTTAPGLMPVSALLAVTSRGLLNAAGRTTGAAAQTVTEPLPALRSARGRGRVKGPQGKPVWQMDGCVCVILSRTYWLIHRVPPVSLYICPMQQCSSTIK
jgi:hypothetical protein